MLHFQKSNHKPKSIPQEIIWPGYDRSPATLQGWPNHLQQAFPGWDPSANSPAPLNPSPGSGRQIGSPLPCSSLPPNWILGSSSGRPDPPPSGVLRFFDIWTVPGSGICFPQPPPRKRRRGGKEERARQRRRERGRGRCTHRRGLNRAAA